MSLQASLWLCSITWPSFDPGGWRICHWNKPGHHGREEQIPVQKRHIPTGHNRSHDPAHLCISGLLHTLNPDRKYSPNIFMVDKGLEIVELHTQTWGIYPRLEQCVKAHGEVDSMKSRQKPCGPKERKVLHIARAAWAKASWYREWSWYWAAGQQE